MLSFKLNTEFVDSYRGLPEPFGFSGLGAVAFYRTYSRQKDNGDYESWTDVCERVINGMYSIQKDHCLENNLRWSDKKAQESAKEAFDRMFNLKWSPAGRGMWMMGTKFIHEDKTSEALLNCAAISTKDIATKMGHIFEWFMEMLMLGVGVGGDTKGANTILVYKPMLEKMVVKVPDSREGWAESVKLLVDSYLHHGHVSEIEFDYSLIREKGQPIKRFGGVSSGSEPLKILHERVRSVLDKNHNSPITSRTIVDIFNAIGGCVVSGNVRRCLPGDAPVQTISGYTRMEDVRIGDIVVTGGKERRVTAKVSSGRRETIKISHRFGEIECTPNHRVAVFTGVGKYKFVDAGSLSVGDRLVWDGRGTDGHDVFLSPFTEVMHSNAKDFVIPAQINGDVAWLIGAVQGDGSISGDSIEISEHVDYYDVIEKVSGVFSSEFKCDGSVSPHAVDNVMRFRLNRAGLARWFREHVKVSRESMSVPGFVIQSSRDTRFAYLAGVFDTDGRGRQDGAIEQVSTVYGDYADQIVTLLSTLGIGSVKREFMSDAGYKVDTRYYTVSIVGNTSRERWIEGVLPHSVSGKLDAVSGKTFMSPVDFSWPAEMVNEFVGRTVEYRPGRSITQARLSSMLSSIDDTYMPSPVTKTDTGRIIDTWDIEVEDIHQFTTNGIVVHNSAEIMFGEIGDEDFVKLKDYTINPERADIGWSSNNSILAEVGMNYEPYLKNMLENGEPGFVWTSNMQKYGRMGEESIDNAILVNPCGEQPLANKEMCLLAEIYLNRHDDMDDFLRTIKFAYLYAKSVSLTYEWITDQESREIMCKNRRIGLSITGMAQFVAKHGVNNFVKWADTGYQYTKHYDKRYSQWLAVNESIRVTTQKPSGCRPWHSLTTTDDGIFTLEDLFQDHGENEIWANFKKDVKVYQDDGLHQITRTYNNGKSATKIIKLTYGIELTSTPNHKWYVSQRYTRGLKHRYQDVNSWVEAKDLQRGDILQIAPSIYNKTAECALEKIDSLSIKMRNDSTDIIQPEFTNPEIGWLMGYLWGDGAMSPGRYRIRFTDSRIENLQKAQNIIESQFGVSSEIKNKNREAAYTLEFGSKMLWHWLIKNGIWKYFADKLDIIPLVIRRASKETIIAFIAGLLDSDGCISATNDKCNKIIISTAHDLFADHLHHVAMAVGIVFGKSLNASGNSFQSRRHMWNLTSTPQSDPESIKTLISHSNKCKNTARDLPWQHECDFRNTKTFGRVDSVIDGEEMDTYDIEVGDGHYYYAGAIKSHNTASLLAGATPGVHHPHSQYYIRRIRIASDSNLVKILGNLGFHVEDDSYSKDTSVIEFPIYAGENIPSESDLTIWEQLEFAALTQKYWSDNAVSVTIKVNPNKTRKEEVGRALQMYEHKLKTVSFLPEVDGGAYTQMPYETITKEQYDAIVKNINFDGLNNLAQAMTPGNKLYDMYCDGNSCSLEAR